MVPDRTPGALRRAKRGLDAANFFLADVRAGLGPYLAIYLLTVQKWDQQRIGVAMSIATIAGIVAQTPAGALVDTTRAKRGIMVVAAVMVTATCLLLPWLPSFWPVAVSQAAAQAAGTVFEPALAAVTLGIVGQKSFAKRVGRNEFFNHAGNAFAAAVTGLAAFRFGPVVVFYLLAVMAAASLLSVLIIPGAAIDHDVARGLDEVRNNEAAQAREWRSGWTVLVSRRPLLIFAVCVALFHLANAAMLPLVGQQLASQNEKLGTTLMSVCIVAAQVVMLPMALLVGAKADAWGRKPLFLLGLIILPVRAVLYTLSDNPFWLMSVQLLDGVGAGIFGAIFPILIADVMRGTDRFNFAHGAISTAQGIGAALSTSLAGIVVVHAGYRSAFLTLGGVASAGLVLFFVAMPETRAEEGEEVEVALLLRPTVCAPMRCSSDGSTNAATMRQEISPAIASCPNDRNA